MISCFVFIVFSIVSVPASAIDYVDKNSFKDLRFTIPDNLLNIAYNCDYWVLLVAPYSYSDCNKYISYLYLIYDDSQETFGSEEGVLRFYTDTYPHDTRLYVTYNNGVGSSSDYSRSYSLQSNNSSSEPDFNFLYSSGATSFSSYGYYYGFVFDDYNLDKFPTYEVSNNYYTSAMILASNVDIYNQYGQLLQYGNYYTLLQYFGGALDSSKIKDYSGHETAPGVTVEPTTGSGTGDSQTSKDQLETSKGIWGTVKDIFNSIANLPDKIADSIGGFFTDLKDGLIEGIKFLFVPSNNIFDEFVEFIRNKFGFVFQIIEIKDFLLEFDFSDTPPDLSFDFSGYSGSSRFIQFLSGFKFELLDWSVIDPYRGFIRGLISAITWYFFLKGLPKTVVNLINGQIGDENI